MRELEGEAEVEKAGAVGTERLLDDLAAGAAAGACAAEHDPPGCDTPLQAVALQGILVIVPLAEIELLRQQVDLRGDDMERCSCQNVRISAGMWQVEGRGKLHRPAFPTMLKCNLPFQECLLKRQARHCQHEPRS